MHLYISLVKSVIRLIAGTCLILIPFNLYTLPVMLMCAGIGLVVAELLGIAEELC